MRSSWPVLTMACAIPPEHTKTREKFHMVKNLTHFSLYLPSKGQFQEMDGEHVPFSPLLAELRFVTVPEAHLMLRAPWQQHLARSLRSLPGAQRNDVRCPLTLPVYLTSHA